LVAQSAGCNPDTFFTVANGGSNVIAIVDAFHNPTAKADLQFFSTFFGLPAPHLQVVYCSASSCAGVTTPPPADTGWAGEIALDVQAAHAMAPRAKIILVEAFSNSFADLMRAVDRAKQLVAAQGGGQVSNSYGGSDAFSHTADDPHFVRAGVVFFASTGDHKSGTNVADVEWPSTSPNVVAVGGTTILRRSTTNAFVREQAWLDGGGGISTNEIRPSYQNVIHTLVGAMRGVPDISADADPASGMFVRCAPSSCGQPVAAGSWLVVGGTSLASPLMAGITNAAGNFRASSKAELISIYGNLGSAKYNDITTGKCGNGANGAFVNAVAGWDRCTGVGTPKGRTGL
jgi:subtilase family serine protease